MAKFEKDWVDAYFDHGIDIANRRVFLDKDIDEESIGSVVRGLYLMETESTTKPVEMFINSVGGLVYESLALYDIMNTIKCPIHTFAYGKCMSAAPLLLAAGEPGSRWVAPHAIFMHHDTSTEMEGTTTFLQADLKHTVKLHETRLRLLAEHSTKDFKWWSTRASKAADFYFTAEEAMEWGLADHMWSEK